MGDRESFSVRKQKIVNVRIEKGVYDILEHVAKARGENVSIFVRRAIIRELAELGYLPEEIRKAFGIKYGPK